MATLELPKVTERIELDSTRGAISEIAAYLQGHLGQRVTAYLAGLTDPKMVGQWAAGKVHPRDLPSLRLRHAYQAARLLVEEFGDETARAWFFGTNTQLDDEAPAYLLRRAQTPEDVRPVLRAARRFVEVTY
jgi:hypothetical protein